MVLVESDAVCQRVPCGVPYQRGNLAADFWGSPPPPPAVDPSKGAKWI